MTDKIQIFNYKENKIRTVEMNGKPWFVLRDVCTVLGISNPRMTAQRLDADEVSLADVIDSVGRHQETTVISESGLYNVILRSDKPEAKPFRKWVTNEVLPSIHKNGAYITPSKLGDLLRRPESVMEMLAVLSVEQQKNAELTEQNKALAQRNEEMRPKEEYFDDLVDTNSLMNFTDTAKALKVSRKKMLDVLVEQKLLYRQGKYGKLIPYEKNNHGYFEVKEQKNAFGSWAGPQTFVTVAGRQLLMQMRDEGYFD